MRKAVIQALLILCASDVAHGQGLPQFQISRAAQPPQIDGDLKDEVWRGDPLDIGDWLSYNPLYGEKACAFIISRPGRLLPSTAELGSFLLEKGLAKFKLPERIEPIDVFPITRVGKLDRAALRAIIADRLKKGDWSERRTKSAVRKK